jgi:hypothetical protein
MDGFESYPGEDAGVVQKVNCHTFAPDDAKRVDIHSVIIHFGAELTPVGDGDEVKALTCNAYGSHVHRCVRESMGATTNCLSGTTERTRSAGTDERIQYRHQSSIDESIGTISLIPLPFENEVIAVCRSVGEGSSGASAARSARNRRGSTCCCLGDGPRMRLRMTPRVFQTGRGRTGATPVDRKMHGGVCIGDACNPDMPKRCVSLAIPGDVEMSSKGVNSRGISSLRQRNGTVAMESLFVRRRIGDAGGATHHRPSGDRI